MGKTIKFKYIYDDDYNPKYANGAYGGITPRGEIAVHFYFERPGLPYYQSNEIDEKGKIGPELAREPEDIQSSFVRVIENGVILDLRSAKTIVDWLNDKIVVLEKANESQRINKEKK